MHKTRMYSTLKSQYPKSSAAYLLSIITPGFYLEMGFCPNSVTLTKYGYSIWYYVDWQAASISWEEPGRKHSFRKPYMWGWGSNPNHTTGTTPQWLLHWIWKVFESPSQNPELNPFENLWNNLKTDRHRCSSSSLSKLQHICILGWGGGRDCVLHSWCCIQFQEQRMEITSNHCFQ